MNSPRMFIGLLLGAAIAIALVLIITGFTRLLSKTVIVL